MKKLFFDVFNFRFNFFFGFKKIGIGLHFIAQLQL